MALTDESKVARVYAEALFEAATEAGQVEQVRGDLEEWRKALEESDELRAFFLDEDIPAEKKEPVLAKLAAGSNPLFWNFLRLLVSKDREPVFAELCTEFTRLMEAAAGVVKVQLVTAVPLPAAFTEQVRKHLETSLGKSVELVVSVDEDILGGVKLRIGDRIADASIRQGLESLRARLISPTARLEETVEAAC